MNRNDLHGPWSAHGQHLRYYSLARHALIEALRLANVGRGDHVLLPEFLCRELLASITILGAKVHWYSLGSDLRPLTPSTEWPHAKAVLAVNYFGFPQKLLPFEEYSARCGAAIIEDNAHGFLSRDETGQWLGCRTKLGIFSLRKTIRMPDGAALFINDPELIEKVNPQLPFVGRGFNPAEAIKATMKKIPLVGSSLANLSTNFVRINRWLRFGQFTKPASNFSERELPFDAEPWCGVPNALISLDKDAEAVRRRRAYLIIAQYAAELDITPVFSHLPQQCVPYGFPFRAEADKLKLITKYARKLGFGTMSWPDLPTDIQSRVPAHYRDIRLVNFLW